MTDKPGTLIPATPSRREPITIEEQGDGFHAVLAGADGQVFITNDAGRKILELCDGVRTPENIAAELAAIFDAEPERIRRDVDEFFSVAFEKDVVQWNS